MSKTAIFYGSTTGNTESAAEQLAEILGAISINVADAQAEQLNEYDNLIFGTSTWGIGDLQDDWEDFISTIESADLKDKVVAIYGLGDSIGFGDSFVDGIGSIYQAVKNKDCKVVGFTSTDGYDYDESTAEIDGQFVGLPLDEDNQSDLTSQRIEKWAEAIISEFI